MKPILVKSYLVFMCALGTLVMAACTWLFASSGTGWGYAKAGMTLLGFLLFGLITFGGIRTPAIQLAKKRR